MNPRLGRSLQSIRNGIANDVIRCIAYGQSYFLEYTRLQAIEVNRIIHTLEKVLEHHLVRLGYNSRVGTLSFKTMTTLTHDVYHLDRMRYKMEL